MAYRARNSTGPRRTLSPPPLLFLSLLFLFPFPRPTVAIHGFLPTFSLPAFPPSPAVSSYCLLLVPFPLREPLSLHGGIPALPTTRPARGSANRRRAHPSPPRRLSSLTRSRRARCQSFASSRRVSLGFFDNSHTPEQGTPFIVASCRRTIPSARSRPRGKVRERRERTIHPDGKSRSSWNRNTSGGSTIRSSRHACNGFERKFRRIGRYLLVRVTCVVGNSRSNAGEASPGSICVRETRTERRDR